MLGKEGEGVRDRKNVLIFFPSASGFFENFVYDSCLIL